MIRVDETDPVGEIEPSFPYRDVTVRKGVQFKDHYDIQSEIGRGKFGTVYQCKEKKSGLALAAKVVNTTRKEDRRAVEREVEIMRRLQHPRLIQLYDAIDTGKQIYVILELIQGGELFERVIDDDFVLTERSCAVFMRQICEGIEFVHAQHILHLDMKPENILCLTKEGNRIKIIDFGLAREYDPQKKLQVLFGTPEFVAPEVVNFDQIGFGTDMWSIGVICYVLLSGLSPFMGDTDIETMANVTIAKYDFDDEAFSGISEDAKDFIRCLLVKDVSKRTTASQCRQHRWLVRKKPMSPLPKLEKPKMNGHPKQELDVTKDNLRLFVERWREHPDSPYTIEVQTSSDGLHSMQNNSLESISLRCQSPSPCGSLSSSVSDSTVYGSGPFLAVPNIGLTFERRASEGANVEKVRDAAAQIVLAEEIIKLSEHLRSIAMGQRSKPEGKKSEASSEVKKTKESTKTGSDEKKKAKVIKSKGEKVIKEEKNSKEEKHKKGEKNCKEEKNNKEEINRTETKKEKKTRVEKVSEEESNEISEKLSNITRQRKLNGTTFNGNRFEKYADSSGSSNVFTLKKTSKYNTVVFNDTFSSKITDNFRVKPSKESDSFSKHSDTSSNYSHTSSKTSDSSSKISEPFFKQSDSSSKESYSSSKKSDTSKESNSSSKKADTSKETNSSSKNSETFSRKSADSFLDELEEEMDLTPPWRKSRSKRRFSESCRDVPRITNLQDLHKTLNLNEPKSTKDLLLHLLTEWDDTRPSAIGRKSSVDWCGEESVARRSMNSLAEYFQSEQKKSATTSNPVPSIHR